MNLAPLARIVLRYIVGAVAGPQTWGALRRLRPLA